MLLLASIIPTSYGADAQESLSWEECVKEAREAHPDLRASRERIRQAEALRSIAASDRWPQVRTDLELRTGEPSSGERTDTYSYGITATQLLFDGFKVSYDASAASEAVRAAEFNYNVTSSDVRYRLRSAFVELLKVQELVRITQEIVQRRKQNADLVRLRYEAGREHKGALLTAEANLAQAEFELSQAQRSIRVARRSITKELGREDLPEVNATGGLELLPVKNELPDFGSLAKDSPVLMELRARRETARFSMRSAKVDFYPEISASAHAGRTDNTWPPGQDEWSAGILLSFPLFEGGRRIAEVSRAQAAFDEADADVQSGRDEILLKLEEAWTEYTDSIERAMVLLKFLEAGRERAKIAQAQYGSGLISFDNWTIIEDDLVRSEKNLLEAKANALIAEAAWFRAKGRTLENE